MIDFIILVWNQNTIGEIFLIFWVLPSLITFLLIVVGVRYDLSNDRKTGDEYPMIDWDDDDWAIFLVGSLLYPIGIFVFILAVGISIWSFIHASMIKGNEDLWKNIFIGKITHNKKQK